MDALSSRRRLLQDPFAFSERIYATGPCATVTARRCTGCIVARLQRCNHLQHDCAACSHPAARNMHAPRRLQHARSQLTQLAPAQLAQTGVYDKKGYGFEATMVGKVEDPCNIPRGLGLPLPHLRWD